MTSQLLGRQRKKRENIQKRREQAAPLSNLTCSCQHTGRTKEAYSSEKGNGERKFESPNGQVLLFTQEVEHLFPSYSAKQTPCLNKQILKMHNENI